MESFFNRKITSKQKSFLILGIEKRKSAAFRTADAQLKKAIGYPETDLVVLDENKATDEKFEVYRIASGKLYEHYINNPGISVKELQNALSSGDINIISSISGIGKKTAERIIVELRDSFSNTVFDEIKSNSLDNNDSRLRDAILALTALGYSNDASSKMVKNVAKNLTLDMTVEEIIRSALIK